MVLRPYNHQSTTLKVGIERFIGNTPLVQLHHIPTNPKVRIFCKLEGNNPGGSVKDRAAFGMITKALERGTSSQVTNLWRQPAATQASHWP
jgi:cysteine synthase